VIAYNLTFLALEIREGLRIILDVIQYSGSYANNFKKRRDWLNGTFVPDCRWWSLTTLLSQ
jgi:hypothetical protein